MERKLKKPAREGATGGSRAQRIVRHCCSSGRATGTCGPTRTDAVCAPAMQNPLAPLRSAYELARRVDIGQIGAICVR